MPEQPQASAPGQAQQAPFGASPATGPTPNRGYEAQGLQKLGIIIKQLEEIIPMLGATSDPGKDALKALNLLVKNVPPGSVTPAAQKNNIDQLQLKNAAQNQQMAALKQQQAPPASPPATPAPGQQKAA